VGTHGREHGVGASARRAHRLGYVQRVDMSALLAVAMQENVVIRIDRTVGHFIASGTPLVSVAGTPVVSPEVRQLVNDAFMLGAHRDIEQDAASGVGQLVEIALKALSPSTNDPATAITCIDYLAAIFIVVASRREKPPWRVSNGALRLIAPGGPTFTTLVDSAFDEIRRAAASQPVVLVRLLDACCLIGEAVDDPERQCCLRRHVDRIEAQVAQQTLVDADRASLGACIEVARRTLTKCARTRAAPIGA
jgi:uncharacterized membrane protein